MNMGVDAARCQNQSFAGERLCGGSDRHARRHAVHNRWISGLSDSCNPAVLDSDICLVNTGAVQHQRVGDDKVEIAVRAGRLYRLSHTVSERFASAELAFIAVDRIVFFHLNHQAGICEADFVSSCGTVHHCIMCSGYFCAHVFPSLSDKSFLSCLFEGCSL